MKTRSKKFKKISQEKEDILTLYKRNLRRSMMLVTSSSFVTWYVVLANWNNHQIFAGFMVVVSVALSIVLHMNVRQYRHINKVGVSFLRPDDIEWYRGQKKQKGN